MDWFEPSKEPNWQMPSLHSPGPGPALAALLAEIKRGNTGQQLAAVLEKETPELMKAVRSYRADQMSQSLLDNASNYDREYQPTGDDGMGNTPTQSELMARSLNNVPGGGSDAYALYQKANASSIENQLKQAQIDKYKAVSDQLSGDGSDGQPDNPQIDWNSGTYWDGNRWVKLPNQYLNRDDPLNDGKIIARGKLDDNNVFTHDYSGADTGPMAQVQMPDKSIRVVPFQAPAPPGATSAVQQQAAQSGQSPATSTLPAGHRIITGPDGHHYEVDDNTKRTIRQID